MSAKRSLLPGVMKPTTVTDLATGRWPGDTRWCEVRQDARCGRAQAHRAGISVAVDDLLHPKGPSGAAYRTPQRRSNIDGDAAPLGLGVRGRCPVATDMPPLRGWMFAGSHAGATNMPVLRTSRGAGGARTDDRARTNRPNQPVEATETRGSVIQMETGDRTGAKGLRASPHRWP